VKYRSGYKYQLVVDEVFVTVIAPGQHIKERFIELTRNGKLTIKAGYAWDGPSGPTYDSTNSLRASLAHDAIYQLMRMGLIKLHWRSDADILLNNILEEDGMWALRRWYWLKGVQWFAGSAADPENRKTVLTAP